MVIVIPFGFIIGALFINWFVNCLDNRSREKAERAQGMAEHRRLVAEFRQVYHRDPRPLDCDSQWEDFCNR